jgi:hypothetical protein
LLNVLIAAHNIPAFILKHVIGAALSKGALYADHKNLVYFRHLFGPRMAPRIININVKTVIPAVPGMRLVVQPYTRTLSAIYKLIKDYTTTSTSLKFKEEVVLETTIKPWLHGEMSIPQQMCGVAMDVNTYNFLSGQSKPFVLSGNHNIIITKDALKTWTSTKTPGQ